MSKYSEPQAIGLATTWSHSANQSCKAQDGEPELPDSGYPVDLTATQFLEDFARTLRALCGLLEVALGLPAFWKDSGRKGGRRTSTYNQTAKVHCNVMRLEKKHKRKINLFSYKVIKEIEKRNYEIK